MELNTGSRRPDTTGNQRYLKTTRQPGVTVLNRPTAPPKRPRNAGIMGGISFDQNSVTRPYVRPSLLENQPHKPCSLTTPRVITAVYTSALIIVLLVLHMHMQFAIRDWKMQQRSLQLRRHELDRQTETINRINTQFANLDRLQAYAVEHLRMQRISSANTIVITEAARRKYAPKEEEKSRTSSALAADPENPHRHLSRLQNWTWPVQ